MEKKIKADMLSTAERIDGQIRPVPDRYASAPSNASTSTHYFIVETNGSALELMTTNLQGPDNLVAGTSDEQQVCGYYEQHEDVGVIILDHEGSLGTSLASILRERGYRGSILMACYAEPYINPSERRRILQSGVDLLVDKYALVSNPAEVLGTMNLARKGPLIC